VRLTDFVIKYRPQNLDVEVWKYNTHQKRRSSNKLLNEKYNKAIKLEAIHPGTKLNNFRQRRKKVMTYHVKYPIALLGSFILREGKHFKTRFCEKKKTILVNNLKLRTLCERERERAKWILFVRLYVNCEKIINTIILH